MKAKEVEAPRALVMIKVQGHSSMQMEESKVAAKAAALQEALHVMVSKTFPISITSLNPDLHHSL